MAYNDPTANNDSNAVQDSEGNDAVTLASTVVTNSVADTERPAANAPAPFSYKENWNINQNPFPSLQVTAADNIAVTQYRFSNAAGTTGSSTTTDGYFSINSSGQITLASGGSANSPANDFEATPNTWSYYVQAGDAANNWSAPVAVTLNEQDVAGEPVISGATNNNGTAASGFNIHYLENRTNNAADIVGQILASAGSQFYFENGTAPATNPLNTSADGFFQIDVATGKISLTQTQGLPVGSRANNYEVAGSHVFNQRIAVRDSTSLQMTYQNITLTMDDMVDETAPVFNAASSYVDGDGKTVHLLFDEPVVSNLSNAVGGIYGLNRFGVYDGGTSIGISSIASNPSNPNDLIINLASAVSAGTTNVKVQYTDPNSTANDYYAAQDVNGNDLATFAQMQITNNTDGRAPVFQPSGLQMTDDGRQIILTYDENLSTTAPLTTQFALSINGNSFNPQAVYVNGPELFLQFPVTQRVVSASDSLTVKYNAPVVNNANTNNAIQDTNGNDALSFGTKNVMTTNLANPADTVKPTFNFGSTFSYLNSNGLDIQLRPSENILKTYWSTSSTDPGFIGNAFTFTVDGTPRAVAAVDSSGSPPTASVMTFTLAGPAVTRTSVVKVSYTDLHPSAFDAWSVRDTSNNEMASFVATTLTNNSIL